jgi:hypothetical protein
VLARLAAFERQLDQLQCQGDALMSKAEEILTLVGKINTATNEVAADLARLRGQITGGVTEAEAVGIVAELTTLEARLTSLGADSSDPVPVEP